MLPIELEYVLGDDRSTYENLIASLPEGDSNLKRGIVLPSHTKSTPQTFRIKNLVPNLAYAVDVQGEWENAPVPRLYFSPNSTEQLISLPMPYGPSTVIIKSRQQERRFFVSVTHYGTIFRTFAREITENSVQPLSLIDYTITDSFAYRLALPILSGVSTLIPSDLESMGILAHKLIVKNLLHRPGTNGAAREVLASFSASNPVFNKMVNTNSLDAPLYRSEETFSGYEAHVWLPNREIERWKAFSLLLTNLPQFYTMKEITEGEVFFLQGSKLRRHSFDFDSPFANSVIENKGTSDCFMSLFKVNVAVESDHTLNFCQASYPLDSQIQAPGLSSTDVDPLQVTNWQGFSLTGRLEQQFGESAKIHRWVFENSLIGEIDGYNRFFRLRSKPKSTRSVKLWIDGLLQHFNYDYRLSLTSTNRSGSYEIQSQSGLTQTVTIETGEPRSFIGPCFTSLEVRGNADLQMLLTVGEQTVTTIKVVISDPPGSTGIPNQDVNINYVAPALPSTSYSGANQYGIKDIEVGTTTYYLEFDEAASSANYKLLVQLAVTPFPTDGGPNAVSQVAAIVRLHNLDGALVEFSEAISDINTKLYWWLIEEGVGLERGTLELPSGASNVRLNFSQGPYFDKVVLVYQLWYTTLDANVPLLFISHRAVGPGGTYIQFSDPIPDGNYRLDWVIFGVESGAFLEIFEPPSPGQLLEVQYDEIWPHWGQAFLTPPPDGYRREFALPFPLANEKSVYLAMNGRIATYGHDNQYVINPRTNTVIFNEAPAPGHLLWAVMPLVDPETNLLPSAWDQGFAFSRADFGGSYASGMLRRLKDNLPINLKAYIAGQAFYATNPARGTITILGRIVAQTQINFEELGVSLVGVTNPVDVRTFSPVDVSAETDTLTIPDHGLTNGRYLTLDTSAGLGTLPLGLTIGVKYYVINATDDSFQLSLIPDGLAVNILTPGVGIFQLQSPNENFFAINVSPGVDASSLAATINAHSILSSIYLAESRGANVTIKAKDLGGGTKNQTLSLQGPPGSIGEVTGLSVVSITGDSSIASFESKTFTSGTKVSLNPTNIVDSRIVCGAERPRFFEDLAVSFLPVKDIELPPGLSENVIYYMRNVEKILGGFSFSLSSSISSSTTLVIGEAPGYFTMVIHQADGSSKRLISERHNFCEIERVRLSQVEGADLPVGLSSKKLYYVRNLKVTKLEATFDTTNDIITVDDHGLKELDKVIFYDLENINLLENTTYFVSDLGLTASTFKVTKEPYGESINLISTGSSSGSLGISNSFQLSETISGDIVSFENTPKRLEMTSNALTNSIFSVASHGLLEGSLVTFEALGNSTVPQGLISGGLYSVINSSPNSFQLAKDGIILALGSSGSGSFSLTGFSRIRIESAPQFVANVGDRDIERLCNTTRRDPNLAKDYWLDCADNATITVRAKRIGSFSNNDISAKVISTINGSELDTEFIETQNIRGGSNPLRNQSFATGKMLYSDDGSVIALDGLSTRLYKPYSGNEIKFNYRPISKQEPYYYGEVFPVENHPLDSMIANEPCSYPRGVFTQGLFSQLVNYALSYTPESLLLITSTNLPVQEEPLGLKDGLNTVFTLNFVSAAGQNALMLFIDGVFQPSDTYNYATTTGGQSVLTLSSAPVAEQKLWVWYIPIETMLFNSSAVDPNTDTFTIESHSLYNGQVISLWTAGGTLPAPLEPSKAYYVINSTLNTFQLSLSLNGSAVNLTSQGVGSFRINPSSNILYEKIEPLLGSIDGNNQVFSLENGPIAERQSLILFLEGLYQLQGEDYLVASENTGITYADGIIPQTGQTLWAHYHQLAENKWSQVELGIGDGVTSEYTIETLLESERPTSADAVLIFLNGLCQRQGIDFNVGFDALGYPDGKVIFVDPPELGRKIHIAYIKRG